MLIKLIGQNHAQCDLMRWKMLKETKSVSLLSQFCGILRLAKETKRCLKGAHNKVVVN